MKKEMEEKWYMKDIMIEDTKQKLIASKLARIVYEAFELGCEFSKIDDKKP